MILIATLVAFLCRYVAKRVRRDILYWDEHLFAILKQWLHAVYSGWNLRVSLQSLPVQNHGTPFPVTDEGSSSVLVPALVR